MPVRLPSRRSRPAGPTDPMVAALAGTGTAASVPTEVAAALAGQGMGYSEPFSPGSPMAPNWPAGSPPRAWNVPAGYNIAARPRSSAGRMSFDTLRAIIASWDLARICIEHIEDDIRSMAGHVTAADGAEGDVTEAVAAANRVMKRPDGVTPFDQWLVEWMEDILRFDAGALHIGHLRNGQPAALEVVSGTDIAPLLTYSGRRPRSPAPAYTQFLAGVPGVWMSDWKSDWRPGDLPELIYQPFRPQPESPYGLPPMEYLLLTANTDIRFQWHFLQTFTEGSIPAQFAEAPPDQSDPEAIARWQELWDGAMEGDQSQRHKVKWVPAGTKMTAANPESLTFDSTFPEYLIRRACAAFKVTPNDLGFTLDVNRSTGETQTDVQFRIGTLPRVRYLKGIIDFFLQDVLKLPVQYEFDLGQEKEDRLAEAQAHDFYVKMGAESPDEVRANVLGLPVDNARPVPRFIFGTRTGPIPLSSLLAVAGEIDPETAGPDPDAVLPTQAFAPVAGVLGTKSAPAAGANPDLEPGATAQPAGILDDGSFDAGTALAAVAKAGAISVAGLCVKAADTGRILMLQRSIEDPDDPARGTWEFPGGHLEDDETERPIDGAIREWQEETGCVLPLGQVRASWISNGIYQGFVYVISFEADVAIDAERQVANPDDPDGDWIESVAWFDPADVPNMPALRPECRQTDWNAIEAATMDLGVVYKAIAADLRRWRANATTRVTKGQAPRRFTSDVIPPTIADVVWARLEPARTPAEVADAFGRAFAPKEP